VLEAIESALAQTVPVKVIVVEDCGPDPGLRDLITARFGDPITYFRNPKNRGLFDNWNACMEYCTTSWISILHDDDLLRPGFVAAMLALHQRAPECSIYFGRSAILEGSQVQLTEPVSWPDGWRKLELPRVELPGASTVRRAASESCWSGVGLLWTEQEKPEQAGANAARALKCPVPIIKKASRDQRPQHQCPESERREVNER